jgi:cytosine/adenosine deaminase-related metal-dependent hydrolase
MTHTNYFFQKLEEEIDKLGGLFNAHTHIDRFATAGHNFIQNIQTITIMKSYAYGISNLLHVSSIKGKLIKENLW